MSNLNDLIAQKNALEQRIAEERQKGRTAALQKIQDLMTENELSWSDIGAPSSRESTKKASAKTTRKVAAKYRDPATGTTWSGRGLQPKWLKAALAAGKKVTDFAI